MRCRTRALNARRGEHRFRSEPGAARARGAAGADRGAPRLPGFQASALWGCRRRSCAKAASVCARRSSIPATNFRPAASPSISHRWNCSKEGGRYDLPIALALLCASGQLKVRRPRLPECYGELGLGGELRPVRGLLLAAIHSVRAQHGMLVPAADLAEARLARHTCAHGFATLREACEFLSGESAPEALPGDAPELEPQCLANRCPAAARRSMRCVGNGRPSAH